MTPTKSFSVVWVCLMAGCAMLGAAASGWAEPPPQPQDAKAQQLQDQMIQAYKELQSYQSQVQFKIRRVSGGWELVQSTSFQVAGEREGKRLLVSGPDWQLATQGDHVLFRSQALDRQLGKRHLDAPLTQFDYESIAGVVPVISQPIVLPDVVLLLANDPIAGLGGDAGTSATYLPPSATDARPGLQYRFPTADLTLRLDPATHLISNAVMDMQVPGAASDKDSMTQTFDITIAKRNEKLDETAMTIDTTGSTQYPTLQAMVQSGAPASAAQRLLGQDAPAVQLKTLDDQPYKLADEKARVVVLDFWATWCGPCRLALPKLQQVYDWAAKEGKSVAIYAVNQGEKAEQVREFWANAKLTIPVLMDADESAGLAFAVEGIPQTVVLHRGKVVDVQVGFNPNMDQKLKAKIEQLLAEP